MLNTHAEHIDDAKRAALEVLLHNARGPHGGLPRTAGWGYPEPYTRDLMISMLGIAVTGNEQLLSAMERVLRTLARNQSTHGHIPSLVHDKADRGSSDSTPLFLLAAAVYRMVTREPHFLAEAVDHALAWMEYQSPDDRFLVVQQPTTDWRDEQWVLGNGLYVNTVVYTYLRLHGQHKRAQMLSREFHHLTSTGDHSNADSPPGLVIRGKPFYALWAYKIYRSERFDLLGNSLAILSGLASPARATRILSWLERQCTYMRQRRELAVDLAPNLFPFIQPGDADWRPRYQRFNRPGDYHNGGIWPFVSGFHIAALVAAGQLRLASRKLVALTALVGPSRTRRLAFGFNEWFKAQDGRPMGQDWQTWSAAMYLYAAHCVEQGQTPFFDAARHQ